MQSMACNNVVTKKVELPEHISAACDEPVSPTGQYFNCSVMSISILAIFESEIPIDDSCTLSALQSLLLPLHPRFSSIMVEDEHGARHWKRVTVKLEDHIKVPTFDASDGRETYDDEVFDYVSCIARLPFPQSQPLWDLHIIKYPTQQAAGTMVFRISHALGDGFSLMSALFSVARRADDPSLPLTFPTSAAAAAKRSVSERVRGRGWLSALSVFAGTVRDFGWSLWKSKFSADDHTALRSAAEGVEFRPLEISTISFSLEEIRRIKIKVGGTVNDVIVGVIFYGTRLYLEAAAAAKSSKASQVTALVLLNTRTLRSYQNPEAMTKPDAAAPWGNNFAFLLVSVPPSTADDDPLRFVLRARKTIKTKKESAAAYLTAWMLETIRKLIGPKVAARYIYSTTRNTSMAISNLVGPSEKMLLAGHPVKSFHFMVAGSPQSLTVAVVSYMGKLKVAMGTEKGFIDSGLLIHCMNKSFQKIFEAAAGNN